jgi:uncharacterized protein YggE
MPSIHRALIAAMGAAAFLPPAVQAQEERQQGLPLDHVHRYEVSAEHAALLEAARQASQEAGFLEVSGEGRVAVPADRARVVFAVETEGTTAGEASSANAELMTAVLDAVRSLDLEGLELETHGYSLTPEYTRASGEGRAPKISGYRAQNHVGASIDDPDLVGQVIDAAIGAGANRVTALTFEADDTEPARREALRQAVAQARAEAEAIAEALGVPLGPPMEVRGNANVPGPLPRFRPMMMEAAVAAATPVEVGEETVTASVTIKYRLGGSD